MVARTVNVPLVERLLPARRASVGVAAQILLGVALLAATAQLRFEIGAVPVTGQTFGVLLIAATFGLRLALPTVGLYLLIGGLGLPVFANAGLGWATFAGATGGYLVGFLFATVVVGLLARLGWDRSYPLMTVAMVIGNLVIYAFGLVWLSGLAPDLATTLQWGLWPFLVGDAVKVAAAVALVPTAWKLLGVR